MEFNVNHDYTITVDKIRLDMRDPEGGLVGVAQSWKEQDGTYSRKLVNASIKLIGTDGKELRIEGINNQLDDLKVTSSELTAAGTAIGIDWSTAKGVNEEAVIIYAFLVKVGTILRKEGQELADFITGALAVLQIQQ